MPCAATRAERAEDAHARWEPIRAELLAAPRDPDPPRDVWTTQRRMEPAQTLMLRSDAVDREERRARGPAEDAMVAEARGAVDLAYGDAVADPRATAPHIWIPADFGW